MAILSEDVSNCCVLRILSGEVAKISDLPGRGSRPEFQVIKREASALDSIDPAGQEEEL